MTTTTTHQAFHLQIGDNQEGTSPSVNQVMFPNGHVASRAVDEAFEAMVIIGAHELSKFSVRNNPNAKQDLDGEICLRATGSRQVSHRTITRVGAMPDGSLVFHIRYSDMLVPTDEVGAALAKAAGHPDVNPEWASQGRQQETVHGEFTHSELHNASAELANRWVLGTDEPDEDAFENLSKNDLRRRDALLAMLRAAMKIKAEAGHDPRYLSIGELLPKVDLDAI